MENNVNKYALSTRAFFINQLDFLNGEVQGFIPADHQECTGVTALDAMILTTGGMTLSVHPMTILLYFLKK